jgi:hypothetical protein
VRLGIGGSQSRAASPGLRDVRSRRRPVMQVKPPV